VPGCAPALLLALWSSSAPVGQAALPDSGFAAGWGPAGRAQSYTAMDLYGRIDGGAELFLEYGFEELIVRDYAKGDEELTLESYRMDSPEAALGIYLAKLGREEPVARLDFRASFNPYQLNFVKGRYFGQVDNFSGKADNADAMIALARDYGATLPRDWEVDLFRSLPQVDLIPGSERLLRGRYALEPVYTFGSFGKSDALSLDGEVFAVMADYEGEQGETFTRIVVEYSFQQEANDAFVKLRRNLDPAYRVLEERETWFSFEDRFERYAAVDLRGTQLTVKIDLTSPPSITDDR